MDFGILWLVAQLAATLAWIAGLVMGWRGRWGLPYLAIAACALFNIGTIFAIMTLPRHIFGSAGEGDGFGVIALFVFSGLVLAGCVVAAILTAILQAVRQPRRANDQI